jgi:hypothetical protein
VKRIVAALFTFTCAVANVAFGQAQGASPSISASGTDSVSQVSVPSGWREIIALDGLLVFNAPKDVLIVPHSIDKYSGSEFRAKGLRINFWFVNDGLSGGSDIVIDGHSGRIFEAPNLVAVFLPDVAKLKPGGVGEIKGLRLNVTYEGKSEEAAAIVRSIRFSAPGNPIELAAQTQAASFRTWKRVAAGDMLTFDAPLSLQPRGSTANDARQHRFRATGFEVEIESRKVAHPPAEYTGKEVEHSRIRIDDHWAEVFVKPGQMIAYFRKSLSETSYEGPVIEFRFDNFEAQEDAVALLRTIRLQPLTAQSVRAATPVPTLRGASAEDQLYFAIAFSEIDQNITTRGAKGVTVEYNGELVVVNFPDSREVGYSAQVSIDRKSGTVIQTLVAP